MKATNSQREKQLQETQEGSEFECDRNVVSRYWNKYSICQEEREACDANIPKEQELYLLT